MKKVGSDIITYIFNDTYTVERVDCTQLSLLCTAVPWGKTELKLFLKTFLKFIFFKPCSMDTVTLCHTNIKSISAEDKE